MSLLDRSLNTAEENQIQLNENEIPLNDINETSTLNHLKRLTYPQKLQKINEINQFISFYLKKLKIKFNPCFNHYVFLYRLEKLYPYCQNVPKTLQKLWNKQIATDEEYWAEHTLIKAFRYSVYWNYDEIAQEISEMIYEEKEKLFIQACGNNDIKIVKYMVANDIDEINIREGIRFASIAGFLEIIEFLDKDDENVIFIIQNAIIYEHWHIVIAQLQKNFDFNETQLNEILEKVCECGQKEIVKIIFEKYPDLSYNFKYLLHKSAESNNLELVKYLVENTNKKCDEFIISNGFQNLKILKYIINAGIYVNSTDALILATQKNNFEFVKYIMTTLKISNNGYSSTFTCACENNNLEIVKYTLQKCENINISHGLRMASIYGNIGVVKYLMENYHFSTHLLEDILCDTSAHLEISVMRYLINQGVSNIADALVEIMKELPRITNKTKKKYELAIQLLIEMGAEPDLEKIRKYLPHLV